VAAVELDDVHVDEGDVGLVALDALARGAPEGLEIVRYSPMERNIPGYIGEDALIRFYKDPATTAAGRARSTPS
jgi:hypothetical protein